ncbi:acyl-homoserine-lactone synthase [Pectobacterium cacticida]|uniref:acyl-homoserine-lactone synthase n=1 Tax=Pectobacterium cacticida TaxID=69221 RepID=UPI003985D0A5
MLEIFDVSYAQLSEKKSQELFTLRKETFKDRLDWAVQCTNGMEFDQYDNENATYLFGVEDNKVICSSRLIETRFPNMITGTFFSYFNRIDIPEGNYIESSRFFVDKARSKTILGNSYPVSMMFFLATVNYSRSKGYDGVYTIVSHPMFTILKRSGWKISIAEEGLSEKQEKIYLLHLPVDKESQDTLIHRINHKQEFVESNLRKWPLSFEPVIKSVL